MSTNARRGGAGGTVSLAAAASLSLIGVSPALADVVKIFVVAGQSNAVGYNTAVSQLPAAFQSPRPGVRLWYELGLVFQPGFWVTSGGTAVALQYQCDPTGAIFGSVLCGAGPELSAGHSLADSWAAPVAVVKVASNGSSLSEHWHPDAPGGTLYPRLISAINSARTQIMGQGHTPVVAGFFWQQGETDASNQASAAGYGANLTLLIDRVRTDLGTPELPFIIGRINANLATSPPCSQFGCVPFLAQVRSAQESVILSVLRTALVNTDDLSLMPLPDGVHFTTAGQVMLGLRYAAAWLGMACYANCDGSAAAPVLNVNDYQCFLNKYAAADSYANCDGSTSTPILNVNDFQCFLNKYAAGCP